MEISKLTEEIIRHYIGKKEFWIWSGKRKNRFPEKPNIQMLQSAYWNAWEVTFIHEHWLPKMYRAYEIFRIIKSGMFPEYTDLDYAKSHFVVSEEDGMTYIECDDCLMELQFRLEDDRYRGSIWGCYMTRFLNNHPELAQQEPTMEMIEHLGLDKPTFGYQPTLF